MWKNILAHFLLGHCIRIAKEHNLQLLQGSVETLFRWGGERNNCMVISISRDINSNNYGKSVDSWWSYFNSKMGDIFYDHNAGSAKSIEPGQPGSTEVNKTCRKVVMN